MIIESYVSMALAIDMSMMAVDVDDIVAAAFAKNAKDPAYSKLFTLREGVPEVGALTPNWIASRIAQLDMGNAPGTQYLSLSAPFVTPEGTRAIFTPAQMGLSLRLPVTVRNTNMFSSDVITAGMVAQAEFDQLIDGRCTVQDFSSKMLGASYMFGNNTALHGLRGSVFQRRMSDTGRTNFYNDRDIWLLPDLLDNHGNPLKLRAGCYVITGFAKSGKSTIAKKIASSLRGPGGRVGAAYIEYGERGATSLDGFEISPVLLELSIAMSIRRAAVLDSARYFQMFAAGNAGTKGLSKGMLALLTSWSRACAALGVILFVVVHPFELSEIGSASRSAIGGSADRASEYGKFVEELTAAATGIIRPSWANNESDQNALVSIDRPMSEGGRDEFTARAPGAVGSLGNPLWMPRSSPRSFANQSPVE